MTAEQYNKLSRFKDSFMEAKSGYYRALLMTDAIEINNIWVEMGNPSVNIQCSHCLLGLLKEAGTAFFNYKPEQNPEPVKKTKKLKK